MNVQRRGFIVPASIVVAAIAFFSAIGFLIWYYLLDAGSAKLIGFVGGIASGLVVFILTYAATIGPLRRLDRYEKMGVLQILESRHDKTYYAPILSSAEKVVRVMGASCTRFVEDFLDPESDDHVLIDALSKRKRLRVQLLIPDDLNISENARARLPMMQRTLAEAQKKFDGRITLRRFASGAHHSFIIADDQLIAGPIFQDDRSKYAPAVHVMMRTRFAQKYDEYFESVWNACASEN